MSDITDEIDLIEFLKKIYIEKHIIIKFVFFAAFLGVIYSISLPNKFTSSTTFIPQLSTGTKSTGSSLSGLASLAGISIGNIGNTSEFPPTLYPQVVNGLSFRLSLLSSEIQIENDSLTIREYLNSKSKFGFSSIIGIIKKYTIGLPSLIFGFFSENSPSNIKTTVLYSVTEEDEALFNILLSSLSLTINNKEGFITISYTDRNNGVAAQITQKAKDLLQKEIINFKNKSSKELLDLSLNQYEKMKIDYENLQDQRAIFVDKNINISSSLYQNKLSRIESELSISKNIVSQLAVQVEQARLKVNKDTPVFTTIQPVTIPFSKSSPNRAMIVISFVVFSLFMSVGFIVLKDPARKILRTILD